MNCDFSLAHYKQILETALSSGYSFLSYDEDLTPYKDKRVCVLRHDIDTMLGGFESATGSVDYGNGKQIVALIGQFQMVRHMLTQHIQDEGSVVFDAFNGKIDDVLAD